MYLKDVPAQDVTNPFDRLSFIYLGYYISSWLYITRNFWHDKSQRSLPVFSSTRFPKFQGIFYLFSEVFQCQLHRRLCPKCFLLKFMYDASGKILLLIEFRISHHNPAFDLKSSITATITLFTTLFCVKKWTETFNYDIFIPFQSSLESWQTMLENTTHNIVSKFRAEEFYQTRIFGNVKL
jgi:hypothetical protein